MKTKKIELREDVWSQQLVAEIKKSPTCKTAILWGKNLNISNEKTPYYGWLKNILINEGSIWNGIIKNENDIIKQVNNFKQMFKIAPKWNIPYKGTHKIIENSKEFYFGDYPCQIRNDGNLEMYDGRHRLSIILAKNLSLPKLTICKREKGWQKIYNLALKLYPNKHLYQPILHPDFQDWNQGRMTNKEDVLITKLKKYQIKSVIDLGSCHGYTLYRLKNVIKYGVGIEYNLDRYRIASKILNFVGMKNYNNDIGDFMQTFSSKVDIIFALASLHHYMYQNSIEKFNQLLTNIKNKCDYFVYELPSENEKRFNWMYFSIRNQIDKYIESKLNFKKISYFISNNRKINILRKK